MKIINFGSLNIDLVYSVDHLARKGETITSRNFQKFAGGKGLNQSIALARAGANVHHAGKIGADGRFLKNLLIENGVDVSLTFQSSGPTGHAIITVDRNGENSIILFGGANRELTTEEINQVFTELESGDYILLQNEINGINQIITQAIAKKLKIILNPAPMSSDILTCPLQSIEWLIVNEVEGRALSNENTPQAILEALTIQYPDLSIVLTLGKDGVCYARNNMRHFLAAEQVSSVDTTGAGDTFIGFFIAEIAKKTQVEKALEIANKAAAICVTRHGAAESIPTLAELKLST